MRTPWPAAVGGVVVAVIGAAGLVRGAVPLAAPRADQPAIVISDATVRPAGAGTTRVVQAPSTVVPAQGRLVLSSGRAHLVISTLSGPLRVGQTVNLALRFARAGEIAVTARVVPLDAPTPTGGS